MVEGPRSASLDEAQRDRIAEALRLADRLGGDAVTVPGGRRIAEDILAYARSANVNHIIVGKAARSWAFELINGSVVHDLVRLSGAISIHVVPERRSRPSPPRRSKRLRAVRPGGWPGAYALALLVTAIGLGLALLAQPALGTENADLFLLTGVVTVAIRSGLGPSLAAVLAASLAYNFFFLPPLYTSPSPIRRNVAAFVLFTIVAVLVSNLRAARV